MTIIDVAKKAGVSCMTISRVISGSGSVKPETRKRVLEAMQELNYVPSLAARAMRSKDRLRTESLLCCGLIFGADLKMADSFFSNVTRSAEQEAAAHGLCLLQSHWQDSFDASWPRMQAVLSVGGLCGVVLAGQFSRKEVQAIQNHVSHVVIVDGPAPSGVTVAAVEPDYAGGCRMAFEHLMERGSKKLLVLTGESDDHYFSKAISSAVEMYRQRFEHIEVAHSGLTLESGYEITHRRLSQGLDIDAVFGNDESIIGALSALSNLNRPVPLKVKALGFDDIAYSRFTSPPLTTVRIDKSQLGCEAVRMLVELVRGKDDLTRTKKVLKASLVIRQST